MRSLVQDDVIRASSFFALALVIATVGGTLLGEPRSGIEVGLGLGAAFGVFAYFFVAPTGDDTSTTGEGAPDDQQDAPDDQHDAPDDELRPPGDE